MSLFKKIGKIAQKAKGVLKIAQFIPGPIGVGARALRAGITAVSAIGVVKAARAGVQAVRGIRGAKSMSILPRVMGGLPAVLPGAGSIIGGVAGRIGLRGVGRAVAGGAVGAAIFDAAGNLIGYGRKRRRINPLNYRALKRAIRRVEGAHNAMKRVGRITIKKDKC